MKKIFLSILIAIMTSLTIYFVAFWQPKEYVNEPLEVKKIESSIAKENNKENNKENIKQKENFNKGNINNYSENIEDNSYLEKDYTYNLENNENKDLYINSVNENLEEENLTQKIFNIEKNQIIDKLSLKDKVKLLSIARKISVVDVEKIKSNLNKDGEEGIIEVARVLKDRLQVEDYNIVKDILSPYVNIKFIESII